MYFSETVCGEWFYQNFKLDTPFVTFVDSDRTRRPHEDKVEKASNKHTLAAEFLCR
jgi:hypothetical protein